MPWKDVQQVCLNGHQITDNYKDSPLLRKDYCTTCGARTIIKCPKCLNDIPGQIHYENFVDLSGARTPVPKICQYCGENFPWTENAATIRQARTHDNPPTRVSPKRILKILGATFGGLSIVLGIITDGFQAWDLFTSEKNKSKLPIINMRFSQVHLNYSTDGPLPNEYSVDGKIETGNGIYRFVDSVTVDSIKIVDSSYFLFDYGTPTVHVVSTSFDKMILGHTATEQNIGVQLKANYILKGDKVLELYNLRGDKLIATITLAIPYYFDEQRFSYSVKIPILVYYR